LDFFNPANPGIRFSDSAVLLTAATYEKRERCNHSFI